MSLENLSDKDLILSLQTYLGDNVKAILDRNTAAEMVAKDKAEAVINELYTRGYEATI